jgi:hypothetical protein
MISAHTMYWVMWTVFLLSWMSNFSGIIREQDTKKRGMLAVAAFWQWVILTVGWVARWT